MNSSENSDNKTKNEKKELLEVSEIDDVPVPENMLVKFRQCRCGALLDSSDTKCWSCGKEFVSKQEEKDILLPKEENNDADPESEELISQTQHSIFISCEKCGSVNEILSRTTKCWFCGLEMDTSEQWNKNEFSTEITGDTKERLQSKDQKEKKESEPEKPQEEHKEVKESKKILKRYVVHCTKCNSWFISNTYNQQMECASCGNSGAMYVSFTCDKCKKFFDLSDDKSEKCPYCGMQLTLTKENALY
ncbi:MAG: hypothetical protein GF364_11375 [Candidatus Lokiarchaeota archaeon]|nr:hypothetical protein [Candidatus Lokiarchaeota archaeon]